ncbi:MAG: hypothetical protein IIC91_02950 [Chloroflexi bacterium]|nr:hypothetical protein [Chloroflexota bacterium]MCH8007801.1 hypothetical protein [Chloroflexota bacterium]
MAATGTQVFGQTVGRYEETDTPKGLLLPQKMGSILWAPMTIMGIMLVFAAFGMAIARAQLAVDLSEEFTALRIANFETIGQLIPGFMFLGFGMIFAGISFAIARILGVFREGGGLVQEAVGKGIKTPDMPITAWIFLMGMMMAMMVLIFTFAGHIYAATQVHDAWINATSSGIAGDQAALGRAETWGTWLEGLRLFAVGLFLTSIAFGLATIIKVIRFQSLRMKELAQGGTASA